ncbi:hypothetical protein Ct61P_10265 [Colletotrichum tofieldiae]|nr:hypothetical protein Ct61P_10265 [Colletotrichum tofieldiae]
MAVNLYETLNLVDFNGQRRGQEDFAGKVSIVFFGYSNCAKVCPRALNRLSEALDTLGNTASNADNVNCLYVSVDPERDTPEVLKSFLSGRAPRFIGLTGTREDSEATRKAFQVFARRKEDESDPGGYVIPHTAITYIIGPDGLLMDHLHDSLDLKEVVSRIRKCVEQGHDKRRFGQGDANLNDHAATVGKESLDRLNRKQVASMRHIGNLARQLKGDWSNMMGPADLNDGFNAYRFQIAYATYALALAHLHRLPAAPGAFQPTFRRLIEKMCHTDVWFYWREASRGGGIADTPRKKGETDPIAVDNIMYSAYLQSMTALYEILFNDGCYTEPGSIRLEHKPFFWGDGDFKFEYDQNSINDIIYWKMVENGYIGVACEPGCIFQICNQPAILGFRWNDELKGTKIADEVTTGYVKAWDDYGGRIDSNGILRFYLVQHIQMVIPSVGPGVEAWCLMLMHSWNPDFVEKIYEDRKPNWFRHHGDGTLSVAVSPLTGPVEGADQLLRGGEHGWVAAVAAEMGDEETLNRLLRFADDRLSPRFERGGLMYPRSDTMFDERGNYILSSPMQSNALFPLARLNVRNGFQRLYEHPWSPRSNHQHYEEPALSEVHFSIDVYRAVYVADKHRLLFDVAAFEAGASGRFIFHACLAEEIGPWTRRGSGLLREATPAWRLLWTVLT